MAEPTDSECWTCGSVPGATCPWKSCPKGLPKPEGWVDGDGRDPKAPPTYDAIDPWDDRGQRWWYGPDGKGLALAWSKPRNEPGYTVWNVATRGETDVPDREAADALLRTLYPPADTDTDGDDIGPWTPGEEGDDPAVYARWTADGAIRARAVRSASGWAWHARDKGAAIWRGSGGGCATADQAGTDADAWLTRDPAVRVRLAEDDCDHPKVYAATGLCTKCGVVQPVDDADRSAPPFVNPYRAGADDEGGPEVVRRPELGDEDVFCVLCGRVFDATGDRARHDLGDGRMAHPDCVFRQATSPTVTRAEHDALAARVAVLEERTRPLGPIAPALGDHVELVRERAAVVSRLRKRADAIDYSEPLRMLLLGEAEAIERGDHRRKP